MQPVFLWHSGDQRRETAQLVQAVQVSRFGYRAAMNVETVTSSEAKESFALLLGSLADEGPVQITRNGRPVGVLAAPPVRTASLDALRLTAAAALFASGPTTWREVADDTGAAFGDLLLELARQALALPRATATKRPAQVTLLSQIFQRAGESRIS